MTQRLSVFVCCFVFLIGFCSRLFSQNPAVVDTTIFVVVYTTDGNKFTGTMRSESPAAIVLKTGLLGDLTIQRSAIRRMEIIPNPKIVRGRVWFENRHAPRHFVAPSAYGLRGGEFAYENSELFFSQISYGFTDHFSLGAGCAPFFVFWDGPFPFWVMPKLSFPLRKDKLNLALGGFHGRTYNGYIDGRGSGTVNFSSVFSLLTWGSKDANITVGLGYRTSNNRWVNQPVFSLAGQVRLTPNLGLLAESYFYKTDYERIRLFGGGLRFMGRGFAIDAGVAVMAYQYDGAAPIPYGTLHIPFGLPKN